jgi:DNA-binding CsgD family transcriptional regulator
VPVDEVVELMAAAGRCELEQFEARALRSLGRLVGFDGAVWGQGVAQGPDATGFRITRACLVDRPASLLTEYAQVAALDPVTARFLARPEQALAASAADYDRQRATAPVGDYLRRHGIAQLLLQGSPGGASGRRRWVTAYREAAQPFTAPEAARLGALLPLWNQAHALCGQRELERAARGLAEDGGPVALCDAAGVLLAAEAGFGERTGLAEGALLDAALPARWRAGERATQLGAAALHVRTAGPWWLLQAGAAGRPRLSPREDEVARRYVAGCSYKEIARALGSSPSTVRTQLQDVYRKLGVHSRISLLQALRGA